MKQDQEPKLGGTIGWGFSANVSPPGSHALLTVYACGGILLLILGILMGAYGVLGWPVWLSIFFGAIFCSISYLGWSRTQKDIDKKDPPTQSLEVSDSSIKLSGPAESFNKNEYGNVIVQLLELRVKREKLPEASGEIQKNGGNVKIVPYSVEESAKKTKEIETLVDDSNLQIDLIARELSDSLKISQNSNNSISSNTGIPDSIPIDVGSNVYPTAPENETQKQ